MASLWTGLYPVATGVTRYPHALSDGARMPAEVLREAGFKTGGIFRNGWVAANFGFSQGFDLYYKPTPNRTPERYERARTEGYSLQGSDLDVTEAAVEFLKNHNRDRFFLYLHYMDVHQYLYTEESALFGSSYLDAYDNAIRWTDLNVAHVISVLDELGLFDDTIVVIASDHGEAFREHGLEGHARNVYTEVTTVPLVISLPFRLEEPVVVEPMVRNIDIWPTLYDLLGIPAPEGQDGVSLLPLVRAAAKGESADPVVPAQIFSQIDQTWGQFEKEPKPLVAVDEGEYRLMYPSTRPDHAELYHEPSDPGEQEDVAAKHPDVVARLSETARRYLDRRSTGNSVEVEIDEMQLEQLRALGYVVGQEKDKNKKSGTAEETGEE